MSRLLFVNRWAVVAPREKLLSIASAFFVGTILFACGGEKQTSVTDSDATTGESQTSGEQTSEGPTESTESTDASGGQTTDMSGSETGEQTTGETTDGTTSDDTKGSETTDDPTKGSETDTDTGGGDPLEDSCAAACEAFAACEQIDIDECTAGCIGEFKDESKECIEAVIGANKCFSQLTCEEIETEEPPFPCEAEEMQAEAVCGTGEECSIGVGMGQGIGQCEVFYECEFDSYGMVCEGQICTCNMNGEKVGMCQNENYCGQLGEGQEVELMVSCCGFEI